VPRIVRSGTGRPGRHVVASSTAGSTPLTPPPHPWLEYRVSGTP
jgi:hypothetical protein